MSFINCDRQHFVKFRDELLLAPCMRADGLAGHAVDVGLLQSATLPYIGQRGHAQLTILWLSVNHTVYLITTAHSP